jgi:hypothetical protein
VKSWVSTWVEFKDGIAEAIAIGDSSMKSSVSHVTYNLALLTPLFATDV